MTSPKLAHIEVTIALRLPEGPHATPAALAHWAAQLLTSAMFERNLGWPSIVQVDGYDEEYARLILQAVHDARAALRATPEATELFDRFGVIEEHMRRRLPPLPAGTPEQRRAVIPTAKTVVELELEIGGSVIIRINDEPNEHPIYVCRQSCKAIRVAICPTHGGEPLTIAGYDDAKYNP